MKNSVLILIVFLHFFPSKLNGQNNSIEEVIIKLVPPITTFRYCDSLKFFRLFFPSHGFQAKINDKSFFEELDSLLPTLQIEKSYCFDVWVKVEIKYSDNKKDILYMTYYRNGYYYKGKKMKYNPELNKLLYKKLEEKKNKNKIEFVGIRPNEEKYRNRIYYRIKNFNPAKDSIK